MKLFGFTETSTGITFVCTHTENSAFEIIATLQDFWANPEEALVSFDASSSRKILETDGQNVPLVPPSARVLCIGLNYRAHVEEGSHKEGLDAPYPTIFARWTASLVVGGTAVTVPASEDGLDWEGEVAAYVGKSLKNVSADEARAAVLGYSTFNDLSARNAQYYSTQWVLGKNADNSGPIGPLLTADEVGDLRDGLRLQTRVNGELVQDGNTADIIYELGEVLSLISHTMTLNPGDVICTGTPSGVGFVRNPKWLLHEGDVVEVEVEKLGILTTPIG